ncbi:MAG TPA: hypothetical protein VJ777_31210 [Mycobacterium sp.]|nr:hypothetical protein [Mycobacterium sp.]
MKIRYLSPLFAVAAAAAIAVAPIASATPTGFTQNCIDLGASNTQCQTPGNVQINDSPQVQYAPQYPFYGNVLLFHHGGHR